MYYMLIFIVFLQLVNKKSAYFKVYYTMFEHCFVGEERTSTAHSKIKCFIPHTNLF